MPNRVDDFVPYRLLDFVVQKLEGIDPAYGYNSAPAVFTEYHAARDSDSKCLVYVESTGSNPKGHGVGGGGGPTVEESLQITVVGQVRYETEHPRQLAFALEQDVRTAIHTEVDNIRASVGRGCSFRWDRCIHDAGGLAPHKKAGFRLEFTFSWSQRSNW